MIDTVVIPAAGLGTRLFTMTKEFPKEMVPIFYKKNEKTILVKPLLEIIFENLFNSGIRNFIMIVGRGKEGIENHLSPHYDFIDLLKKKGEHDYAKILFNMYKKIEKSSIVWVRQHEQKGLGQATLLAKEIVGNRPFLFHAGDLYIPNPKYINDIINKYQKLKPNAILGLKTASNPKQYGVAKVGKMRSGIYEIISVEEKPKNPPSNLILTGVNVFEPEIFQAIKNTKKGVKNEIQLTDGIQTLINSNQNIQGLKMNSKDICIDIGTPQNYFKAIQYSYKNKI